MVKLVDSSKAKDGIAERVIKNHTNTPGRIELPSVLRGKARINDLLKILAADAQFKDRFSFNEGKNQLLVCTEKVTAPITDVDYTNLKIEIQDRYGFSDVADVNLRGAVLSIANRKRFNPVRDYLNKLAPWDDIERLRTVPTDVLHAIDANPLYGRYFETWAISAVARVMEPGCKVDAILVLKGLQGTGKSTFLSLLASGPGEGYFFDSPMDVGTKDGLDALHGTWIIEWQEFEDLIRSKSPGALKGFITSRVDKYRPAYAYTKIEVPRHCVICASANPDEVYRDTTGSRRFLTIPSGKIDLVVTTRDKDLWFAEALAKYKRGDRWYLTDVEFEEQQLLNASHEVGAQARKELDDRLKDLTQITSADLQLLRDAVGISEILCLKVLRMLNWEPCRIYSSGVQMRGWQRKPSAPTVLVTTPPSPQSLD